MTEDSLALFKDAFDPADSISNAIDLLEVVRENFSTENQDHGVWLTLGIVADTIRAALPRIKPAA